MEYQELINKIVEDCINELYGARNSKNINCTFKDKLKYIQEFVGGAFMDAQPIQVVGKDHPAKENLEKQKKKEDKCQKQ